MNREIKLRAYDKSKNKLIFGPTDSNPQPSWILICCGCNDLPLMQYSGLKDINEKDIYEGDIINTVFGLYIVEFNDGCFMACCIKDEDRVPLYVHCDYANTMHCEIKGNIHQNPELLK